MKTPSHLTSEMPFVIFLDDSPLVRWAWENKLKSSVRIRCFSGPEAFFKELENKDSANQGFEIQEVHTIITDHYFDHNEFMTGIEFARKIRCLGYLGRILLASNGDFATTELKGIVDGVIDKQPVAWEELTT